MNTADRSIATIDTALRRRFHFKEMLPDASVLEGIYVEGVSIREMLDKMNKRISVLYDREHTLGHAYFVPLKSTSSLVALGNIFEDNIIPLLQEYFYEDYEKIRMVLGDNNKTNEAEQFIKVKESNFAELFGNVEYEFKVFLLGKSFTSFSGSEVSFALLFPMESLFESYVTTQMNRLIKGTNCTLSAQERKYHLFDEPSKKFLMKPDIVIRNRTSKQVFLMDTKWKVLSDAKANYGISQADMYQMYAYQKKYTSENVTLIYPMTDKIENKSIGYKSEDGVNVRICFVDLYKLKESLEKIIEICKEE